MEFIKYLSVIAIVAMVACNHPQQENKTVYIKTDSVEGKLIADTIIYDVYINNLDSTDKWTDECLQYLKKDVLFGEVFDNIYNGKITAYNFFTKEPLSIEDVKEIQSSPEFSEDAIGKIQFREVWYFDGETQVMNKKVISMIFGLELYNNLGELKGYRPLFKIQTN